MTHSAHQQNYGDYHALSRESQVTSVSYGYTVPECVVLKEIQLRKNSHRMLYLWCVDDASSREKKTRVILLIAI